MVSNALVRLGTVLGLLALFGGCDCSGSGTRSKLAVLNVEWFDAQGNQQRDRNAIYDFGTALIGQRRELTLVARNDGEALMTLSVIEPVSGDDVAQPGIRDIALAPFEIRFAQATVEPGAKVEFPMAFEPKRLKGNYEAVVKLVSEGTREEDRAASLTLKAKGEEGNCNVPDVIDFGNVTLGETFTYPIEFVNTTSVPATAKVGPITGPDAPSFWFDADAGVPGELRVAPATTHVVNVSVTVSERRLYTASVLLQGLGECPNKTVQIRAMGSDDVLSWSPTSLNFGFVNPSDEAIREVVFHNPSGAPVTLTNIVSSMPQDFYHVVPATQNQATLTIAGGGDTRMKVACSPQALGSRVATLTFRTPLMRVPSGTINLNCTGGGPRIRVTPRPTLAFGRVGFFPGSTNFNVARRITVQNVGSRALQPDGGVDVNSNLHLGSIRMDGTPGEMPYFELTPGMNLDPSEVQLALASPYNSTTGLEAVGGRNTVDLALTLTPTSAGRKTGELTIFSNDSTEPRVTLTLSADVQALPPCNYRVTPPQANFGLVSPGTRKDLPITITNLGTQPSEVCYLSGIDLRAGSHPAYSMVGGPIVERELAAGESMTVVVRVEPPGPVPTSLTTLAGELQFNATSPTNPQGRVQLQTSVGPSCLVVAPDPLDFGTVKTGCNSAARTLSLYNSCSNDVFIQGFSLQAAGGQQVGGPNCPGPNACPEFRLVQTPAIPAAPGLRIAPAAAPVTFQVRYSPIDVGSDSGAIAISALQSGQPITYLVGLAGRSDTTGIQTDTFLQDIRPKADVLLVVDDSGSMSDKQNNLSQNFAAFIQYAQAANVDYQIGVTTTTTQEDTVCLPQPIGCITAASVAFGGRLRRIPAMGTQPALGPILRPTTPNIAAAFRTMVRVGTDGSGTEEGLENATRALTPPIIANENAGFVRPDANLAVVVVTDAGDQSAQAVSYYQNRLINVKGFARLSMFTFSNIGPYLNPPPNANGGCEYDGGGIAQRYEDVVVATGGVKAEICNTNWASTLQRLGQTAFGARTQFFLNNLPDTAAMGQPLEVKLDGMVLPASAWMYDSASNSIKFTSTTRPSPGQTLTVTYPIACL